MDSHRTRPPQDFAAVLVRRVLGFADAELRAVFLCDLLRSRSVEELAPILETLCERSEQAETSAREVLVALVDALNVLSDPKLLERFREQAAGEGLVALARLLRAPSVKPEEPGEEKPRGVASATGARTLTLGERKSLARKPDRATLQTLFKDPHPDVMTRVLRNPRLTEDDVITIAARRPAKPEVLARIASEPKWMHRTRVRMALILNPNTPYELGARMASLLLRSELELVATATNVPPAIRALCMEYLERRPPGKPKSDHPIQ